MQHHEENMQEVIGETQQDLAHVIKDAEGKKEMPQEALILSNTETVVFFGTPLERARFKKKWMDAIKKRIHNKPYCDLKNIGRCHIVEPLEKENAEQHHIWEVADVHMSKTANERLRDNATPEQVAKHDQERIEAAKLEG